MCVIGTRHTCVHMFTCVRVHTPVFVCKFVCMLCMCTGVCGAPIRKFFNSDIVGVCGSYVAMVIVAVPLCTSCVPAPLRASPRPCDMDIIPHFTDGETEARSSEGTCPVRTPAGLESLSLIPESAGALPGCLPPIWKVSP